VDNHSIKRDWGKEKPVSMKKSLNFWLLPGWTPENQSQSRVMAGEIP
jgi:hypothetical protein